MFYVSVIQYYFDKTKIWLKITSKFAYVACHTPLSPLRECRESIANQLLAPDYYFCFLQVGTSALHGWGAHMGIPRFRVSEPVKTSSSISIAWNSKQ